jgi:hypothetical protein
MTPCTVCGMQHPQSVVEQMLGQTLCPVHAMFPATEWAAEREKVKFRRQQLEKLFGFTPAESEEMEQRLSLATFVGFNNMLKTADSVEPKDRERYMLALAVTIRDNAVFIIENYRLRQGKPN